MQISEMVTIIREEILKVLEPEYYEELGHGDMKLIAETAARFAASRIVSSSLGKEKP